MSKTCKVWWFAPLYGTGDGEAEGVPQLVAAADLDGAFRVARSFWPTANGWRCLGRQHPHDLKRCTSVGAGWTERVTRARETKTRKP